MRLRVHTASGSVYLLDSTEMTWERVNPKVGILGLPRNSGTLSLWPTAIVGQRMEFIDKDPSSEFMDAPIHTTQVVRVELL